MSLLASDRWCPSLLAPVPQRVQSSRAERWPPSRTATRRCRPRPRDAAPHPARPAPLGSRRPRPADGADLARAHVVLVGRHSPLWERVTDITNADISYRSRALASEGGIDADRAAQAAELPRGSAAAADAEGTTSTGRPGWGGARFVPSVPLALPGRRAGHVAAGGEPTQRAGRGCSGSPPVTTGARPRPGPGSVAGGDPDEPGRPEHHDPPRPTAPTLQRDRERAPHRAAEGGAVVIDASGGGVLYERTDLGHALIVPQRWTWVVGGRAGSRARCARTSTGLRHSTFPPWCGADDHPRDRRLGPVSWVAGVPRRRSVSDVEVAEVGCSEGTVSGRVAVASPNTYRSLT